MADEKAQTGKKVEDGKPTKEEYAVAKFLRFSVQTKEAKLHNMEVHCFAASAAIDALLESKWSASKDAKEPLFVERSSCVDYCQRLIDKGLFHRAELVQRKKDKDKGNRSRKKKIKNNAEKEEGATGDELRERKGKKEEEEQEGDPEKTTAFENKEKEEGRTEEKKEEKKDEKAKKGKPLKLAMTDDQRFLDGEENIYVWIYDPVNAQTLFIGSLIVFGAVALCLFPLWPPSVRVGVYYASLAGLGFVGTILSLAVLRFVLFCAIWLLTLGRHHFWLLPRLTDEVGLLESFRPLYKHDVVVKESSGEKGGGKSKSKSGKKSKGRAKRKARSSDKEDSESEPEFEMIDKGDVEDDEGADGEDRMEGEEEEESEENGDAVEEEEEYGVGDEYYDDEEEEEQNDGLEDDYEEHPDEEEEELDYELKKNK